MPIRLIIDTTAYSGNFERELCKYLTNQTDEHDSGSLNHDVTKEIVHLSWWYRHVEQSLVEHDDNYFLSAVDIVPTPGFFNNGSGVEYEDTPENEILAKASQDEFCKSQGWPVRDAVVKYPSYQSVAIFVDEEPPAEVWEEFQNRARYFAENYTSFLPEFLRSHSTNFVVTGFRIEK